MSATFITGGTGYLGSYVVADLIERGTFDTLYLMSRTGGEGGVEKLWKAMQLHWSAERFYAELPKLVLVEGDHGGQLDRPDALAHVEHQREQLPALVVAKSGAAGVHHDRPGRISTPEDLVG